MISMMRDGEQIEQMYIEDCYLDFPKCPDLWPGTKDDSSVCEGTSGNYRVWFAVQGY